MHTSIYTLYIICVHIQKESYSSYICRVTYIIAYKRMLCEVNRIEYQISWMYILIIFNYKKMLRKSLIINPWFFSFRYALSNRIFCSNANKCSISLLSNMVTSSYMWLLNSKCSWYGWGNELYIWFNFICFKYK